MRDGTRFSLTCLTLRVVHMGPTLLRHYEYRYMLIAESGESIFLIDSVSILCHCLLIVCCLPDDASNMIS